ncbi:MAG: DNA polymerase III subunit beta [Planctomycetes bacterium]|jgi:DNA polymerase-3 subunit beta|nr:DNA polymerase III subunit beta [Planctomycetota bacterium]
MKCSLDRSELLPALALAGGVVERRQTLPILGNLLLSGEGDTLRLQGTDLEIEISSCAKARIEESGSVTVPARKLMDIVRALPEGSRITIKQDGERASLVSGRSRFLLGTLPAADFPTMQAPQAEVTLELDAALVRRLLERTSFAMAQQDVRYYLNGVLVELTPDQAVAVATDGHRLAKVTTALEGGARGLGDEPRQAIIPAKTVLELKRLVSGRTEEPVVLELSERTLRVLVGETVLTSKLVEGRYPDYGRVIPSHLERSAQIDRDALRAALQRTAILSNEKYRGVRLTFEAGRLSLQTNNPEKEEAEDELEIDYSGERVVIGFNVAYVLDVLGVVSAHQVAVEFRDGDSSALWRGVGADDEVFVIMPMRL